MTLVLPVSARYRSTFLCSVVIYDLSWTQPESLKVIPCLWFRTWRGPAYNRTATHSLVLIMNSSPLRTHAALCVKVKQHHLSCCLSVLCSFFKVVLAFKHPEQWWFSCVSYRLRDWGPEQTSGQRQQLDRQRWRLRHMYLQCESCRNTCFWNASTNANFQINVWK